MLEAAALAIATATWTLSYIYDHAARYLPKRLTNELSRAHDLALATLHIDQNSCLEVNVLKGRGFEVKAFAARSAPRPCRDDADRAPLRPWPSARHPR
jgi:NikR C terminal nickel binding domain